LPASRTQADVLSASGITPADETIPAQSALGAHYIQLFTGGSLRSVSPKFPQ
jgi:hypothetical protein